MNIATRKGNTVLYNSYNPHQQHGGCANLWGGNNTSATETSHV